MNNLYCVLDQFGFPEQVMITMLPPVDAVQGPDVENINDVDLKGYWYNGNEWRSIGPKPGEGYVINKLKKAWVPNYDGIRRQLGVELDRERQVRSYYAISVDGVMFDGDAKAQANVKAKLEEVRARLELDLPMAMDLMVWRDANNVNHQWGSLIEYNDFLLRYAIALSERGSRLYADMWRHKEKIDSLIESGEDVDFLIGYDVTSNWSD